MVLERFAKPSHSKCVASSILALSAKVSFRYYISGRLSKIMATHKQLKIKQNELDVIKWRDSELNGDKCGTYDYCIVCDKAVEYPCARAFYAHINKSAMTHETEFRGNVQLSALAQRLQALRLAKNITIEQTARKCHVSAKKLFEYENDKSKPSEDELRRILLVLEKR